MPITNSGVNKKLNKKPTLLILGLVLLSLFSGCAKADCPRQPQDYIKLSDTYYNKGVNRYKELIQKSRDPAKLYFELGAIYYRHGELEKAVEVFQKSTDPAAKKFIAITDYRLGKFSDALEVFNRERVSDDEYMYYYGLTSERLNLFDQALGIYRNIKGVDFAAKAKERIEIIEKKINPAHIQALDPRVNNLILNSPAQEAYPQAGALILLAEEQTEIMPDNTAVSEAHYLIKIFNERGKENFAEASIEYDSTFEKIELEFARTIKPDGRVVDVGSRHIRDVSKYLNFPLYSNARAYIISFPEVAIGAVLEYRFKIKSSELINKKDFVFSYPLQSIDPILTADFSITLPIDRKLKRKVINERYNDFAADLKPHIEESGYKTTYRWHFKNIPQIVPEAHMPAEAEINPTILFSTFNSWEEVYNWWWGLAQNKIKADDAIKDKVRVLLKDKKTDAEKMRAIYNFCAKEIRYVAVEYGQAGYEPHAASDIFRNKYGDCKDKAMLLVTMLQEAGYKAYPVLISAKKYYNLNPDFPAALFNHCIAAIDLDAKFIFLDPTAETCSFGDLPAGDQKRKVLVCKPSGYDIQDTPLYPSGHNSIRQKLEIKVNNDEGITATKANFTRGYYDQVQRYWLLYTQPELIQDALNRTAQDVSIGAKLDRHNIENLGDLDKPVVLTYSFQGQEYFTRAQNLRIMPQLALVDTLVVSKPKRRYPVELGILDNKEIVVELEMPKGYILKSLPDSLKEESPWLSFKVDYNFINNKIRFKQESATTKDAVTQEEYADFKNFIEKLARSIKQRIVLEKVE